MAFDINVVKQGLYKIPVKTAAEGANYKFLQNVLFGLPSVSSNDDFIMMDYAKRGINVAQEAIKGADPTRVNYGTGFNEKAIFGLYFNDQDQVAVSQADNRVAMEEPFDEPWSVEARLAYLLADKRDMIIESHDQALEKACADAALNGQFTARNEGTQAFPITASLLSVSGANMSTNPIAKLTAGAKAIIKTKGGKPTMLVMNPDDAVTLLQSSAMQNLLDNRRVLGNESFFKAIDENGASYCGSVNVPGIGSIDIIAYFGGYDNAGTFTYYIPQGKAILAPAAIGCKGYCGVYVDAGEFTGKAAVDHGVHVWGKNENLPGTTHVQVQSAPAPIITAIDRYCVFTSIS